MIMYEYTESFEGLIFTFKRVLTQTVRETPL